jgi:hypothetical protein
MASAQVPRASVTSFCRLLTVNDTDTHVKRTQQLFVVAHQVRAGKAQGMTVKECKGAPPDRPVLWVVKHIDGTERIVLAQTAYYAAQKAGWLMSQCGEIKIREEHS